MSPGRHFSYQRTKTSNVLTHTVLPRNTADWHSLKRLAFSRLSQLGTTGKANPVHSPVCGQTCAPGYVCRAVSNVILLALAQQVLQTYCSVPTLCPWQVCVTAGRGPCLDALQRKTWSEHCFMQCVADVSLASASVSCRVVLVSGIVWPLCLGSCLLAARLHASHKT